MFGNSSLLSCYQPASICSGLFGVFSQKNAICIWFHRRKTSTAVPLIHFVCPCERLRVPIGMQRGEGKVENFGGRLTKFTALLFAHSQHPSAPGGNGATRCDYTNISPAKTRLHKTKRVWKRWPRPPIGRSVRKLLIPALWLWASIFQTAVRNWQFYQIFQLPFAMHRKKAKEPANCAIEALGAYRSGGCW